MDQECSSWMLPLAKVKGRTVVAEFDGGRISSDGGVVFLRAVEQRVGIVDRLAAALPDRRHPSYLRHSLGTLLKQRVFQIACAYEDANDADHLRSDPALKMGCDQLPESDADLASQPTLSRLENSVRRTDLLRMAYALGDAFIASFPRPPATVILDIDDTADPVHGAQQLALFNAFHDTYCYQPLHIYDGVTGRLITAVLRPGRTPTSDEIVAILRRVIDRLRQAWPRVRLIVRGDSYFARPEVYALCEQRNVHYVLNLGTNPKLQEKVARLQQRVRKQYDRQQQEVREFTEFSYRARSWSRSRRIVAKVEISERGPNTRFVVTNLAGRRPSYIYQRLYAARGQAENYIKNHKTYLHSDRTSCHRFEANQFRLLLHSAAYMLLRALQQVALTATEWENATFETIQCRLLKVAARIRERRTRVELHFPSSLPLKTVYLLMHQRLQGATGWNSP